MIYYAGGVLGFPLKNIKFKIIIIPTNNPWRNIKWSTLFFPYSGWRFFGINIEDTNAPIPPDILVENRPRLVISNLFSGLNQFAASWEGEFKIKIFPIAITTFPRIAKIKFMLIKHRINNPIMTTIELIVHFIKMKNTPILIPYLARI